jgi:hypothetical protein
MARTSIAEVLSETVSEKTEKGFDLMRTILPSPLH